MDPTTVGPLEERTHQPAEITHLLEQVCAHIVARLNASSCAFSHYDPAAEMVVTWVTYAQNPELEPEDHLEIGETYHLSEYPATGHVLQEQTPLCVQREDPQADAAERGYLEKAGQQTLLMVPLLAEGDTVGLLEVYQRDRSRVFTPDEIVLAQALADQAALVIEGGHLFEAAWQEARDLSVLVEANAAVAASLELETVLRTVAQWMAHLIPVEECIFSRLDRKAGTISTWIKYFRGEATVWPPDQPGATERVADFPLTALVLDERQPVIVQQDDPQTDPAERALLQELGMQSLLMLPIVAYEHVVGLVELREGRQRHDFSPREVALAQALASQAAVAIENARLFQERERLLEQTRRRAREMEALNEVGQAITSVLDRDTLLRQIVDITKTRFGYYYVCVALVEGDCLSFHAGSTIGTSEERLALGQATAGLRESHSLVTEAARTAKPVVVNDVHTDPRYLAVAELADTGAEADIPITFQDRVIGVLDVQSDQVDAFGEHEVAILQALVNQAGVAIENARLFADRERRITEMAILDEIGRILASTLDLDQLTQALHDQAGRIFDTSNFFVAVYDETREEWQTLLDIIRGQAQPLARYSVDQGITGYIIRNRCPLHFDTPTELERFREEQGIAQIGEPARSWLGVPMIAADHVVGTIAVESYETENAYSAADQTILAAIAAQAGVAIQNARLYAQVQQQVEELRRANETQTLLWEQVREMSTPVIPVQDRILVLPLVGTIDSERARRLTDRMLQAVRETRALVILLDITGVPVVDTAVAQALIQCASAARLLGAEVVLVGVRSEVAQTLVTLELGMEVLVTKSNLQAGIAYALGRVGLRIVPEGAPPLKR